MPEFKVGVFEYQGKRSVRLMAYTRYYLSSWDGCCEHVVIALNGEQAKRIAQEQHRADCMAKKKKKKKSDE